jgi:uncharacterized membrane protein
VHSRSSYPTLFFAVSMLALGVLSLVSGDIALVWEPAPAWVPAHTTLAHAAGLIMILGALGLPFPRTRPFATQLLLAYTIVWTLLALPELLTAPLVELSWLNLGELTAALAGAWILWAAQDPTRTHMVRWARILFGLSLIPIGLSHFVYHKEALTFVPTWLPFLPFWAYLTGAAHIAAGLAILFSVIPGVAATLEGIMLTLFLLLVWVPRIFTTPTDLPSWRSCWITGIVAAAAWLVAGTISPPAP